MTEHIVIAKDGTCVCGQPLPWHLFELGVQEHVCSCERKYAYNPKLSCADLVGTEPNPFARQPRSAAVVPKVQLKPRSPGASTLSAERVLEVFAPDGAREDQMVALDPNDPAVQGAAAAEEEDEYADAKELHYLEWFHAEADFGPAHEDVMLSMQRRYRQTTGRDVPKGYSYEDDE